MNQYPIEFILLYMLVVIVVFKTDFLIKKIFDK